ncbi:hypothetical protein ASF52_19150 [Methylobacterium sp. Leaf112]|nr:hypothetical protein ASF52_19150 [Methylobacterium sp. Leaf112]
MTTKIIAVTTRTFSTPETTAEPRARVSGGTAKARLRRSSRGLVSMSARVTNRASTQISTTQPRARSRPVTIRRPMRKPPRAV